MIAGLEEKIAQTEALIAQNASDYAALQELTAEKEELETQLAAKMEAVGLSQRPRGAD